jgi:hypothetical protein
MEVHRIANEKEHMSIMKDINDHERRLRTIEWHRPVGDTD